jgi:ribosome-associated protein
MAQPWRAGSPHVPRSVTAVDIEVGERGIRLGRLLKLANLVESGGAARGLLESGDVRVNGEVETRRGRQLVPGDVVECAGERLTLR